METQKTEYSSTDTVSSHHHFHHCQIIPCHHHHHHHHQLQQNQLPCQHHNHHHHHVVLIRNFCAVHGFVPPSNGPPFLRPIDPSTPHPTIQLQPSLCDQDNQLSKVFEEEDAFEELEEDEEEPIFVLTDEWRDFFAKSEAKRKQAKQQAKGKK